VVAADQARASPQVPVDTLLTDVSPAIVGCGCHVIGTFLGSKTKSEQPEPWTLQL
jgi:hypothetical protein